MIFELILTLLTFLFMTSLGLMVLLRNSKSWTSRFFFILTLSIDFYLISNYISIRPPDPSPETQLFWIRVVMSGGSFLGPSLFLLVHTFPKDKLQLKPYKLLLLVLLAVSSAILSLSPYLFTSIQYPNGKPMPIAGPAMPIFALDFAGLFLLSFIFLIIKFRKSKGVEKIQHLYFLAGVIGTFTLMVVSTVFFVVILQLSDFVFFGPISSLILIIAVAYTIVKHRFLDIRLVVARALAYLLFILAIGGFYSISFFVLGSVLFGVSFSLNQLLFYGLTTLVVVFTFNTIRKKIEKFTGAIFYKGYYSSQELLKSLSETMSTTNDLHKLTVDILKKVLTEIKTTRGAFVLFDKEDKKISYVEDYGYEAKAEFKQEDMDLFLERKEIIIFDELEEGSLKNVMRGLEVSIVLPLVVNNEKIGAMLLGERASGQIYTEQDLDVLEILAPQLSVAVQNSIDYEEIKKFNVTLRVEIEKATKELKDANERLKELDKVKDEFVSLASHELRTPMTVIKSYVWLMLQNKAGEVNEKQKTYLERTYTSTERLINLVNDMLNISRIESGRLVVNMKDVDLVKLMNDVVIEMQTKAQELGINLVYTPPASVPVIRADDERIKQVMINLIGNSLKFTPKSGNITVEVSEEEKFVKVKVADTGKGISKDDIPKLFQKFNMVGNNYLTKLNTQGTGLGLYLSKSLIELHGGKIWAESEGEGKGSSFTFTLPVLDRVTQEQGEIQGSLKEQSQPEQPILQN